MIMKISSPSGKKYDFKIGADPEFFVKKFGKLVTLIHIFQARETSKIKIELRKKQLVKSFQ